MNTQHIIFSSFHSLRNFWNRYPALLYGVAAAIGASFALYDVFIPLCGLAIILTSATTINRLVTILTFTFACFLLTSNQYLLPESDMKTSGIIEIEIKSMENATTNFGPRIKYKAIAKAFTRPSGDMIAKATPVTFSLDNNPANFNPDPSQKWSVEAKLKRLPNKIFTLSSIDSDSWSPIGKSFNLVHARYHAKQHVQNYISEHIKTPKTASFLSGIATGQFDDSQLSQELNRFGLQHLMAISGLHFSIIATLLGSTLCFFTSRKSSALAVIILLSAYFAFLGISASVLRAWIAIVITMTGVLIERSGLAINALGAALLVVALMDPLLMGTIGFQFSFGITAMILLWSKPVDNLIESVFPRRSLGLLVKATSLEQHAYFILSFFRNAIALTIAVNLFALPLTLYHFEKFPVLGLVYNLFFPFLVSLSMFLLIAAIVSIPIQPISNFFHAINDKFTTSLLDIAFNLPKSLDFQVNNEGLSNYLIGCYVVIILCSGMILKAKEQDEHLSPSWMI